MAQPLLDEEVKVLRFLQSSAIGQTSMGDLVVHGEIHVAFIPYIIGRLEGRDFIYNTDPDGQGDYRLTGLGEAALVDIAKMEMEEAQSRSQT